jgi:hypothetical protein
MSHPFGYRLAVAMTAPGFCASPSRRSPEEQCGSSGEGNDDARRTSPRLEIAPFALGSVVSIGGGQFHFSNSRKAVFIPPKR